jgi:hypothetical protein
MSVERFRIRLERSSRRLPPNAHGQPYLYRIRWQIRAIHSVLPTIMFRNNIISSTIFAGLPAAILLGLEQIIAFYCRVMPKEIIKLQRV